MYHRHRYRERQGTECDSEPLLVSPRTHTYIDNQHEGEVRAATKLTNRLAELVEKDQVFLVPSLYSMQSASCAHWASGIAHH